MAAKTWLDMSNWTQGEVTFAQAIGLGKYIKLPQLTAVLPEQANAASVAAADKAVAAAAAGAGAAAAGAVGNSSGTGSGTGGGGGTPAASGGTSQSKPQASPENTFWANLLASIGAPVTQANINSLNSWARLESIWPGGPGKGGLYNPLNTTLPLPGATNYNSVGVKNYQSPAQGVQGTAQTLLGGYPAIVSALKSGNGLCGNPSLGANFRKWSGNGYSSVC